MEVLNSESTRDRKDKARDLLLADMSSSDEGSDNEKASSGKGKNRIAREELLADDSDKERANISGLDKKGSKSQRGRQELLADKSSEDEVSERFEGSSETKKNKNEMRSTSLTADKSACSKGREALLADDSSSDEDEKTADTKVETSQCEDKKGRDALLADDSSEEGGENPSKLETCDKNGSKDLFANGLSDDDKENLKTAKKLDGYTKDSPKESVDEVPKNDIVDGKHKKGKAGEIESSEVNEEEGITGFVVLGEYNPSTDEINKLDDDILVQLDGAGKIFE